MCCFVDQKPPNDRGVSIGPKMSVKLLGHLREKYLNETWHDSFTLAKTKLVCHVMFCYKRTTIKMRVYTRSIRTRDASWKDEERNIGSRKW